MSNNSFEQDIALARSILLRHHGDDDQDYVDVHVDIFDDQEAVQFERAPWVIALQEALEHKYGEEKGACRMRRVMTALITHGETIH